MESLTLNVWPVADAEALSVFSGCAGELDGCGSPPSRGMQLSGSKDGEKKGETEQRFASLALRDYFFSWSGD